MLTNVKYIDHFLNLDSAITGRISISDFAYLIGHPIKIMRCAKGLKIRAITAPIKKYKSKVNEKKKKHNKIVLSAESKLKSIEVLISKALINSNISHNQFVLTKKVLISLLKMLFYLLNNCMKLLKV